MTLYQQAHEVMQAIQAWLIFSLALSGVAGYFLGARPRPSRMRAYRAIGIGFSIFAFIYAVKLGILMGSFSFVLTIGVPFCLGGATLFAIDEMHGGHIGRAFNRFVELKYKQLATP